MAQIKLVSWNVNGIRSVLSKDKNGKKHKGHIEDNVLAILLKEQNPDIVCLQEVRCNSDLNISSILNLKDFNYNMVTQNCSKSKKGYSGTLIFSRIPYDDIILDFPHIPQDNELNQEGRVQTVIFSKFILINAYVPNSKPDLSRLEFRVNEWEKNIRIHINTLKQKYNKPIIMTGDFNVAPNDIDVHNPKSAKGKHGFTIEERNAFSQLLEECNLTNTLRFMYPKKVVYTWWSNFAKSRERNVGWTIDHFLISSNVVKKIKNFEVYEEYRGSDHAPIALEITI
jgi:exodeoxyribonuclease III